MDNTAHLFLLITVIRPSDKGNANGNEDGGGERSSIWVHREYPVNGGINYSALYCGALNHINNFFKPDYRMLNADQAQLIVRESIHSYLMRSGQFDGEQQDELSFQLEMLNGLNPILPIHWRENIAHPSLAFFQDIKVLDDYEYTLIYLLIEALCKNSERTQLLKELENLRISWSCTMAPGEGYLSSLMIFSAVDGAKWWASRPQYKGPLHQPVSLDLIATITGVSTALSGQLISEAGKPDLGKAGLSGLLNACCSSIFLLPSIAKWLQRLDKGASQEEG